MGDTQKQIYQQYTEALKEHQAKIASLNKKLVNDEVDAVQIAQEVQDFFSKWSGKLRIEVQPEQQESSKEEIMERIKKMGTPALGGHFMLPRKEFKEAFQQEKDEVLKEKDEFSMQDQKSELQKAMLARVKKQQQQDSQ